MCVCVLYVCMCVRWGGGYLSVRTLLSHSVMIKVLCGTPYHTHTQPTSQLNRNCSAMQPTLNTAHTGTRSHTHTTIHTIALLFHIFHPPGSLFFSYFFISCCVSAHCIGSFRFRFSVKGINICSLYLFLCWLSSLLH